MPKKRIDLDEMNIVADVRGKSLDIILHLLALLEGQPKSYTELYKSSKVASDTFYHYVKFSTKFGFIVKKDRLYLGDDGKFLLNKFRK